MSYKEILGALKKRDKEIVMLEKGLEKAKRDKNGSLKVSYKLKLTMDMVLKYCQSESKCLKDVSCQDFFTGMVREYEKDHRVIGDCPSRTSAFYEPRGSLPSGLVYGVEDNVV